MKRLMHLPFYGDIDHTSAEDLDWDLYQTTQGDRLRDVSLSSIPSRCSPYGQAANRFQHSVGVARLARALCAAEPSIAQYRDELVAASLLHDSGSPPFSHISELFLYDQTGKTHENMTLDILQDSEAADVLNHYGIDTAAVGALINGEPHPAGRILAGSIDLDNLDNSLTLWRSLGQEELLYHPMQLVKAFTYQDGQLVLNSAALHQLLGWMEIRRRLYGVLHNEQSLAAASMLYRAIEYAVDAQALPSAFFSWDESQAFAYLRREAPEESQQLMKALATWHHYPLAYQTLTSTEDLRISGIYDDWRARLHFTQYIAAELDINDVDVVTYVGRDRGAKAITIPFVGEYADACETLFSRGDSHQRVAVFIKRSCGISNGDERLKSVVQSYVSTLPERTPGHVFF